MIGWIQSDQICCHSRIDMCIRNMKNSFDLFTQDEPIIGKEPSYWNPHELDFIGVGNQEFTIEGRITEGSAVGPTGSVLLQFATLASICTLGSPSWFIHNLVLNSSGSVQIIPIGKPLVGNNALNEDEIYYTITLKETKNW